MQKAELRRNILRLLGENGRLTAEEIAERIDAAAAEVEKEIRILEKDNIIIGYQAATNIIVVGLNVEMSGNAVHVFEGGRALDEKFIRYPDRSCTDAGIGLEIAGEGDCTVRDRETLVFVLGKGPDVLDGSLSCILFVIRNGETGMNGKIVARNPVVRSKGKALRLDGELQRENR